MAINPYAQAFTNPRTGQPTSDFSFDPAYRAQFKSPWIEGQGPSDPAEALRYNRDIFSRSPAPPPNQPNTYDQANPNAATGGPGVGAAANIQQPGGGNPYISRGGGTQTYNSNTGMGSGTGYLNSPGTAPGGNPYLANQANAIYSGANQNFLRNINPQIGSAAQAAGQYGSSRHGVMQANAYNDINTAATNAVSNLYGQAYEGDQNRANQRYGIDVGANTALTTTGMNNATQRYGVDVGANTAREGFQNQYQIAGLNNATQRYGVDSNFLSNLMGQRNQYQIAGMGNQTQRDIAGGQLGLGYAGLANQRDIAGGQLGLGYAGLNNQFNIANMGNNTALRGQDLTHLNNQGQLALGNLQANNAYNLGMGNLQLGNRNTDINQAVAGSNIFSNAVNNGISWQDALYRSGMQQMNAPMNAIGQLNGAINPYLAYTGTGFTSTPATGGGLSGAIGGGLGVAQLMRLLGWGG